MRKAFTLIEMLLVIGILAILVTISVRVMGGSSESARSARCLTNLHALSVGFQGYGMSSQKGCALAGSIEYEEMGGYCEIPGWISWYSNGAYDADSSSHKSQMGWFVSTYNEGREVRDYCLTNGAIWRAVGENRSVYCCPSHVQLARRKGVTPTWSYVMNSTFGWDTSMGTRPMLSFGRQFTSLKKTDRTLLFAELPFNFNNTKQTCRFDKSSGIHLDPTLQYDKSEVIGFNHKEGKRWYAHVCFADGHIEKLELPKGAGEADVRKLTQWLCLGADVSYNGSKYEELK